MLFVPINSGKYTPFVSISEAILITGGYGPWYGPGVAELFLPWQNSTCELPPLPDKRAEHVQSGNTLCGGYVSSTKRSCLQWSVQQGGWVTLPLTLTEERSGSSIWRVSQDSLVIMGGIIISRDAKYEILRYLSFEFFLFYQIYS